MKVVKQSLSRQKQQKKLKYLAVGFACFEDLICSTSLFLYKGIQGCLKWDIFLSTKSITFPSWYLAQWRDIDTWRDITILFLFLSLRYVSVELHWIEHVMLQIFLLITNFGGHMRIWAANLLHPVQLPNPLRYDDCIVCKRFIFQTLT